METRADPGQGPPRKTVERLFKRQRGRAGGQAQRRLREPAVPVAVGMIEAAAENVAERMPLPRRQLVDRERLIADLPAWKNPVRGRQGSVTSCPRLQKLAESSSPRRLQKLS